MPPSFRITDAASVRSLLADLKPDEIYYLAAYHHSSQQGLGSFADEFDRSLEVNVRGLNHFLQGIKDVTPKSRLFYAASSLIFGPAQFPSQDENHPCFPDTVYGITKMAGRNLCRAYRQEFKIFSSVGILFNHESHLRPAAFLSKKIVSSAAKIARNEQSQLVIGDLNAEADWGYAPDFVQAFEQILNLPEPDDFVVATGKIHTVKDFLDITFDLIGLDWKKFVVEDQSLLKRRQLPSCGDSRKLREKTGWAPTVTLREMIREMLVHEGVTFG